LKSALKQPSATANAGKGKAAATPAKPAGKQAPTPAKPAANNKAATPASADKPLNKLQLFINSIKESVSVSEMKTLYPKAKTVKMQKRKVGPSQKAIQCVFEYVDICP
jgi:hypothetical protein